jgi:hypothetical protein
MTDNGSAMLALETRGGLLRLGIVHETTLPHSPYQNGKPEAFRNGLESRLMSMLSQVSPLALDFLNRVTQAWVELDYSSKPHREIAATPVKRLPEGPRVARSAPKTEALRLSEGIHLKVEDIDSRRMLVAVRNGKGGQDRYVPLPEPTLAHQALPSPKGRTSPRQLLAAKDLQGGGPPKRHRQERLGP